MCAASRRNPFVKAHSAGHPQILCRIGVDFGLIPDPKKRLQISFHTVCVVYWLHTHDHISCSLPQRCVQVQFAPLLFIVRCCRLFRFILQVLLSVHGARICVVCFPAAGSCEAKPNTKDHSQKGCQTQSWQR